MTFDMDKEYDDAIAATQEKITAIEQALDKSREIGCEPSSKHLDLLKKFQQELKNLKQERNNER